MYFLSENGFGLFWVETVVVNSFMQNGGMAL